ncbi:MAG: FadR family transcriptional regulator [Actinobacteria bacterium]|nr:FadR family transcriptional regulator [Actinomycetota bacterium]
MKPLEVERREATTTEIARRLLRYLLSGAFEPGHRLPSERTLASELAVGRSVIREALKSLVLLGIVEVRQGDGTFLRSAESDLLPNVIEWGLLLGTRSTRDLIEIRRYMEVLTAGLAAERRDERALEKMWSELDAMYAASNPTAFVAADIGFHLAIAAAAGNGVLLQIMTSVRTLLRVWITKNVENLDDTKSIADEHKPVVEAIQAGDPAQARSAMQAHMDAALARLDGTLADAGKA